MIELIQFPWSPFCIVQRRILEFSGVPFKITNIPNGDRSVVWKLTRERYYGVPIIRDGRNVIFETSENSQVIAKYIDSKLMLGLFPWTLEGVQSIISRYIENEIEGPCFKLNDVYFKEMVPAAERVNFVRHKERKFGRGCINVWRSERKELLAQLADKLMPFEEMLLFKPFLLDELPRFVDFDLFGMLENLLYSGHYRLPAAHNKLKDWHRRMGHLELKSIKREKKLHSRYQRSAARPRVLAQL
jgi:glutathione S-transferase